MPYIASLSIFTQNHYVKFLCLTWLFLNFTPVCCHENILHRFTFSKKKKHISRIQCIYSHTSRQRNNNLKFLETNSIILSLTNCLIHTALTIWYLLEYSIAKGTDKSPHCFVWLKQCTIYQPKIDILLSEVKRMGYPPPLSTFFYDNPPSPDHWHYSSPFHPPV